MKTWQVVSIGLACWMVAIIIYYGLVYHLDRRVVIVTATVYQPVRAQCDDNPLETASGAKINPHFPHRYIAVSRDLHRRYGGEFEFDDYVFIGGAGLFDGIWQIKDLMGKTARGKRIEKQIDFLIYPKSPNKFKYKNVRMQKIITLKFGKNLIFAGGQLAET
ncbi:MAG: hypothetical protein PHN44_03685 [Candidatus Marinimicrobia bacterium]|nr:hypothetical protein [Candidatus Neomarinimicrobiota bacterium]MDD5539318.1 hypothetical protein [Candidatus Neomarinimicrobiota bacterium]